MQSLLRNVSSEGFWPLQGEAFLALFDGYVPFVVEDAAGLEYVERCVMYFNNLDAVVIESLCQASIRYCNDVLALTGQNLRHCGSSSEVLRLISPSTLIVPNQEVPGEAVAHLELNHDWEVEHGMEWIVRDNRVLYVGAFNDSDPWGEYLEKRGWNDANPALEGIRGKRTRFS